MSFAATLAAIGTRRDDPAAFAELAEAALAEGEEMAALAAIRPMLARSRNARLWQWTGLLHRALGDLEPAMAAFAEAARLAPKDASIAHGLARVRLEAGLDAIADFDRTLRIAPSGDAILGRIAAQYAMGQGEAAANQLAAILDHNPLWAQGHIQWAQLCSMIGRPQNSLDSIDKALESQPGEVALWQTAIHILNSAGRFADAWRRADMAIAATSNAPAFALARAAALSDAGELPVAVDAFAELGRPANVYHAVGLARCLIRTGDREELSALADEWMGGSGAHLFWPYASIAWRQTGDPRWQWLEGDPRLIQIFDLADKLPQLEGLAVRLRELHAHSGRYLDQSVRGGTQSDGPLLSRIEPEIRALRSVIVAAVETYRANLPPADSKHPMLSARRSGRIGFAGSWSVRLSGAGFHTAHVHPQGWISSAFYVALPEARDGDQGWLVLGEPPADLSSGLGPAQKVEPRVGRLVLFPSMMWHGTLPFPGGERMTVAFDVAPPK